MPKPTCGGQFGSGRLVSRKESRLPPRTLRPPPRRSVERVKDQTTHPAFADGARTYAALFDMKSDPALRDVMTFEECSERYSMYYLQPRSQEDLRRRNRAHRKIADFCFGLMGRTPDAFAGNLTRLSMNPEAS